MLGQQKIDSKSNQITAIPALLMLLHLKGSIETIEAMGTQRNIAQAIVDKGADYVLALKGNQGNLCEAILTLFAQPLSSCFVAQSREEEVEAGHGRIETRRYKQIALGSIVLQAGQGWAGLTSVVEVTATRANGVNSSTEIRYYISSRPLDIDRVANAIGSDWIVENSLHWI